MPDPILFCWSGGKDSAMALHMLLQDKSVEVVSLLTTVTEGYERISMHGVRRELLEQQAQSIGIPLTQVRIPPKSSNAIYEARMEAALREQLAKGVSQVAFGDIFLEDLRVYRETNLAKLNMTAVFPLWKKDTRTLAEYFQAEKFHATAVCIDPKVLPESFAGRELDQSFFADLPPGVDACGENGEFHTFVHAGPIFKTPIPFQTGEIVRRDGFTFADLKPL
jgi:uncharacterized protein (TIGR00290 family)